MRTKTLLLSAALGVLSSASLMAQVYSLNAVGYINVVCPPGFSLIANQLNTTNNNISPLLDAQMTAGAYNNCVLWKYIPGTGVGTGWQQFEFNTGFAGFGGPPWGNANATTTSMNPGEGIYFDNIETTNITLTFVGTVLTGAPITPAVSLLPGLNVISSQVPVAGAVDSGLGMSAGNPLNNNDIVYLYNTSKVPAGFDEYEYNTGFAAFGGPPWNGPTGSAPAVTVGESFFYVNSTATTNSWSTSFSVN